MQNIIQGWEMTKQAKESLSKKLAAYHGEPKEPVHTNTQMSYEDAKAAGNVGAMLSSKLGAYRKKVEKITALSKEVYANKSIGEIQNSVKELEKVVENQKKTVQLMEQGQERKYRKEYSKIGGVSGIHLDAAVADAMEDWMRTDEKYLEAVAELKAVKRDYTAHCNAKEMYIEDNKALIEAEREAAHIAELRSSGVLEELGITQSEDIQNEG